MTPDDPPRRRISDKDRRRWNDLSLDMQARRVEANAEAIGEIRDELRPLSRLPGEFAAFRREFDEWKRERRDDIDEFRTDIRELQVENKTAHKRLAYGKDPEDGKTLPKSRMDSAKDIALILSLLLMPILTTYGLSH